MQLFNQPANIIQIKSFALHTTQSLSAKERFIALFNKQAPFLTDDLAGCLFGNMTLETISANSSFQFILQKFFSEWKKAFATIFELHHDMKLRIYWQSRVSWN